MGAVFPPCSKGLQSKSLKTSVNQNLGKAPEEKKMGDFAVFWCLLTIATHCCMLLSLCKFGDKQWDEQSMASWARPHCHFPLRKCKPLFKSVKVGKSGSVLRRRLEAM